MMKKRIFTFLLILIFIMLVGCSAEPTYTEVQKYDIIEVQGVDLEIKNMFGYTIDTSENDSYIVTYLKNGKETRTELKLGEYGLNKLQTSDNNYLSFEKKGFDTYVTVHLTKENQILWDVSY